MKSLKKFFERVNSVKTALLQPATLLNLKLIQNGESSNLSHEVARLMKTYAGW